MISSLRRIALVSALALCGCLENEEDITVQADGSVEVRVRASGDPGDLADGYAVPLEILWRPATADAERWLAEIGTDTGSAAVQARADEVSWPTPAGKDRPEADLAVERSFASVGEWPRWFAPESEPYRTAYLERSAELEIRTRGSRRVFVFERTYHGRDVAGLDFTRDIEEELPELENRWEGEPDFSAEEWAHIRDVLARRQTDAAERFVKDAVLGLYTEGDASFPAARVAHLLDAVRAAVEDYVGIPRLQRLRELTSGEASEVEDGDRAFEDYVAGYRDAIRSTVARDLDEAGLEAPARNAVFFALEWGFTAFDHLTDLGDEEFRVSLTLPGTLVGGNYDEVSEGRAHWSFDGEDLQRGDVTVRAVSVLE